MCSSYFQAIFSPFHAETILPSSIPEVVVEQNLVAVPLILFVCVLSVFTTGFPNAISDP